ncbi:MAG: sulfatase-like hydrolase/transferase [bacterium]
MYDGRDEPHRRYTTFSTPASLGLPYNVLLEKVRTFLKKRKSSQPLFLYLNFYDTHFPYYHDNLLPLIDPAVLTRFQIHRDRMTELKSMYLNTAANIDRALGIVLDEVRMTLKEVAVIVVSDHGESLFEDGFLGHGFMINDAQTRIPLIVTGLPIVIEEPFGQVDLREAINAALLENPNSTRNPALKKNPEKRVFQYIGFISQPRQIAMTDLSGRIIYDFRSDLVQVGGAEWRRPGNLDPSEYAGFQKLVHFWESILLANKGGKSLLSP